MDDLNIENAMNRTKNGTCGNGEDIAQMERGVLVRLDEAYYLGRGMKDGRHIADLWRLQSGLVCEVQPNGNALNRNGHKWRKSESSDWEP